jgi:hypothetical protein
VTSASDRNVSDELIAIKAVAEALETLTDAGRRHVIAYVADLLGIAGLPVASPSMPTPVMPPGDPSPPSATAPLAAAQITDVRSLKEQKQPRSANEMAALVAYYVSELLPPDERRSTVSSADIEKFFKQANFRLPSRVTQTLPDAARAGYLDAVERGQYKLNPVGYNLVAHGMPSQVGEVSSRGSRPRKKAPSKPTKKAAPSKSTSRGATTSGVRKTAAGVKRTSKKRS